MYCLISLKINYIIHLSPPDNIYIFCSVLPFPLFYVLIHTNAYIYLDGFGRYLGILYIKKQLSAW